MAEVIAGAVFKNRGIEAEVSSRGIFAEEGNSASEYARLAVRNYGLSLEEHVAKPLTSKDIEGADLILTMTVGHKNLIKNKIDSDRVYTLKGFVYGTDSDISDPFGQGPSVYMECAEELIDCINVLAERLGESQKN